MTEVEKIKNELKTDSANPMEYKKRLARQIVEQYNNADAATAARDFLKLNIRRETKTKQQRKFQLKNLWDWLL